jgi:hypothetical protein
MGIESMSRIPKALQRKGVALTARFQLESNGGSSNRKNPEGSTMARPKIADAHMTQINTTPEPFVRKPGNTLAEVVLEWREPFTVRHKPSTVRAAESHIAQHILPKLSIHNPFTSEHCK